MVFIFQMVEQDVSILCGYVERRESLLLIAKEDVRQAAVVEIKHFHILVTFTSRNLKGGS